MMATTTNLSGVPETMLWTLHNRASEALRDDPILRDEDALRIYRSIDYDFVRSFGKPDGSHAVRSRVFDDAVRPWMAAHRGGTVVELGCGLETQFQRVDDGAVRWLCVDLPEAIDVRERFIQPTERCRHVRKSALDSSWIDEIDQGAPVFITAQGLLMYFEPTQVRGLVTEICDRIPGVELMFDAIPVWFSNKTLKGLQKTRHYTTPPMPWGVNRNDLEPLLRSFSSRIDEVEHVEFAPVYRGLASLVFRLFLRTPGLRNLAPSVVRVRTVPS